MKLKTGDTVKVTAGKDKGKQGKIIKIFPQIYRVLVKGVNKYKKHTKPRGEKQPGGIVEKERPLPVSNLALICPKCQQPTRIGYQIKQTKDKSDKKLRICRKCSHAI